MEGVQITSLFFMLVVSRALDSPVSDVAMPSPLEHREDAFVLWCSGLNQPGAPIPDAA